MSLLSRYPFTALTARPRTMFLCTSKTRINTGKVMIEAAGRSLTPR
jgi:hypothetical protein